MLSINLFHILSPSIHNENELFFQSYHHDGIYFQKKQEEVPMIEDLSLHILADIIKTITNPSDYTDNIKYLYKITKIKEIR